MIDQYLDDFLVLSDAMNACWLELAVVSSPEVMEDDIESCKPQGEEMSFHITTTCIPKHDLTFIGGPYDIPFWILQCFQDHLLTHIYT